MENEFSRMASIIGDPVRSRVMWTLLDGRAYTATELAVCTNTSAQNISMHLHKLVAAGLLSVEKQGRHCYYTFASVDISYAIEALANLVPRNGASPVSVAEEPVRYCRTCYDHLAGKVGVMITDQFIQQKIISRSGKDFIVSKKGQQFFSSIAIDIDAIKLKKRSFARVCLDWSERKPHLAGALGAALLQQMLDQHWVRRIKHSRAILVTGKGRAMLFEKLKLPVMLTLICMKTFLFAAI